MTRRVPYAFVPVPIASWRPELSASERAVLGVFVGRWASGDDVLAVGASELASKTGLLSRTCDAARDRLLTLGLLERVEQGGGRGKSNGYRLGRGVLEKGAVTALITAPKGGSHCPQSETERGQPFPEKGAVVARLVEEKGETGPAAAVAATSKERVKTW